MIELLNKIIESVASLVVSVLSLLPNSPFTFDFGPIGQYLGYINYFIPVPSLLSILASYLVAVGIWYAVRWVLRLSRYID